MKLADTWIVHVYTSDPPYDNSDGGGANSWKRHVTLGQETLVTNVYCHMDALHAFLILENCTRLTLVGESMPGNAGKPLREMTLTTTSLMLTTTTLMTMTASFDRARESEQE